MEASIVCVGLNIPIDRVKLVTGSMKAIVEDDIAVHKALKRLFESEGYTVEIRGDGKSALEAFRAVPPTAFFPGTSDVWAWLWDAQLCVIWRWSQISS